MKMAKKGILIALVSFLFAATTQAELVHPTCKINLSNVNAALHGNSLIKHMKKNRSPYGLIPRKKAIATVKKYRHVDVNSMLRAAFEDKGFDVSFQTFKDGRQKESYGVYSYKPKAITQDNQLNNIRVDKNAYVEKMTADFSVLTSTRRKSFYRGINKVLTFGVSIKVTDPTDTSIKTEIYKYTAEIKIKDDNVNKAFKKAVAEAFMDAPYCQLH